MSKHLLTTEQEEELINTATLEYLLRNPGYEAADDVNVSWAGTFGRWNWDALHPLPGDTESTTSVETRSKDLAQQVRVLYCGGEGYIDPDTGIWHPTPLWD